MNWGNYIKRTAVRRVIWIIVGLAVYAILSAFGVARAQVGDNKGEAYAKCMAKAGTVGGSLPVECWDNPGQSGGAWRCVLVIAPTTTVNCSGEHLFPYYGCPVDSAWDDDFKRCNDCGSQPSRTYRLNHSILPWEPATCGDDNSCEYSVSETPNNCRILSGPGAREGYNCWYTATPTGAMCTPGPETPHGPEEDAVCPAGTVRTSTGACMDRGDCPLGHHLVNGTCTPDGACPTGHVKAPDGSCQPQSCGPGQARGADGTCKTDDNDDGTPDEDEETGDGDNKDGKKFSGGDSCDVPPSCSGDAIMCGQARIQWRIDCNTRRNTTIVGGSCSPLGMPICTGEKCDELEHAQLIQQWKAACALDALLSQEGGPIGGGDDDGGTADFDAVGVAEGTVDGASGTSGDGGDPGGAFTDGSEGGGGDGELDTAGLGFGTSCPALPSINVLGVTLDFNEIGPELCDWMSLGGYIVLILSSLLSLRILAGGMGV